MAGFCFFFENNNVDVYSGREIDLDAWNYAAKVAGDIDHFIVVNKTDKELTSPDADMTFEVVDEMPTDLPNAIRVGCEWNLSNSTSLWDFDHQVDWYVFGPGAGWTQQESGIHIPVSGTVALHSQHTASIVAVHRHKVLTIDGG